MNRTEATQALQFIRAARERAELRTYLRDFVKTAYPLHGFMHGGVRLQWSWYLDAVCEFAQAVATGEIRRGIVNLKNRSLKSVISSVCLPPWVWLTRPEVRFFTGGYSGALSVEHSWQSRQLIDTDWYQALKTHEWRFTDDQNRKEFYSNTLGGRRLASQVGGGTGQGASIFVIDDPLSIDQSYSDAATEWANRWFFETLLSRLDDPRNSRVLLVQHRLRPDDTTGQILAADMGFEHLCLPLEYDPRRHCSVPTIGFEDPRTEEGETLSEERWPPEVIEQEKASQGAIFEALSNQNPQKREANVIKEEWIKYYTSLPPMREMKIVQSWDLSFKDADPTKPGTKKRSKTGGLVLGFHGGNCYVIDRYSQHAGWLEQREAIRRMKEHWPSTSVIYIEDEANGAAMVVELSREFPGVIGVNPTRKGGKWQRLSAVSHFFRAGNVQFPPKSVQPWIGELVSNLVNFPNAAHDEDPDCVSQALSEEWLQEMGEESSADRARKLLAIDWS